MFANKIFTIYVLLHLISLIYSSHVYRRNSNDSNNSKRHQSGHYMHNTIKAMARAITTSQVLTFNITNALIVLGFKGILIIAGILGKISFWKYPNLGGIPTKRSFNSSQSIDSIDEIANQIYYSIFSDEDKRWSSAFIWAVNKKDFGCLYRLACENKQSAQIYLYGGRFFNRAAKSVFGVLNLSYNKVYYEDILHGIQEAMGSSRGNCKSRYRCSAPFDNVELISILQTLG